MIMTENLTVIELHREDMKFSAGHYTIFSPTERERLHGHNFSVYAAISARVDENGMAFDYDIYKTKLRELCRGLSECFLLAGNSPYQRIEEDGDYIYIHFHHEKIPFLKSDVQILPLRNISVEELSQWFIDQLLHDEALIKKYAIKSILIKVFTGPGQAGSAFWQLS